MTSRKMSDLTHKRALELLDYDPATGAVTWKGPMARGMKAGDLAGVVAANGRRYISIDHEKHLAHRVVWFMVRGAWPEGNVAPINGDYLDLRLENLKAETPAETASKGGARERGMSGIKGVSYDKSRDRWVAYITRNYTMKLIGRYRTKEEAAQAYIKAAAEYPDLAISEEAREVAQARKIAIRQRFLFRRLKKLSGDVTGWKNFEEFARDIGRPPKNGYEIRPIDPTVMVGPDNFEWAPPERGKFNHQTKDGKAAYERERRERFPAVYRDGELRRTFDITFAQYQEMLLAQNGVCAICKKPETIVRRGKVGSLAVDHCHTTGVIRDLLCERCNKGIGFFLEDPEVMEAAALYVRKHLERITSPETNVVMISTLRAKRKTPNP